MDICRMVATEVGHGEHSSGKGGEEELSTRASPDKEATGGEGEDEVGEEDQAPSKSRYDSNFAETCIILYNLSISTAY